MTRISGPTTSRPAAGTPARSTPASGFSAPAEPGNGLIGGDGPVIPSAAAAPPSAILGLQEVEGPQAGDAPTPDQQRRNRQARQDAATMLDLLGTLQRALLGSGTKPGTSAQLGQLIESPLADDPDLARIQRAIACRAAIELARREDLP